MSRAKFNREKYKEEMACAIKVTEEDSLELANSSITSKSQCLPSLPKKYSRLTSTTNPTIKGAS